MTNRFTNKNVILIVIYLLIITMFNANSLQPLENLSISLTNELIILPLSIFLKILKLESKRLE